MDFINKKDGPLLIKLAAFFGFLDDFAQVAHAGADRADHVGDRAQARGQDVLEAGARGQARPGVADHQAVGQRAAGARRGRAGHLGPAQRAAAGAREQQPPWQWQ